MADILIRGTSVSNLIGKVVEIGYDAADCLYAFVDGGATDILEAIELPEHGDLISKDDAMNAILGEPPEAHYPSWYASIVNEIPAIVPSNKEDDE